MQGSTKAYKEVQTPSHSTGRAIRLNSEVEGRPDLGERHLQHWCEPHAQVEERDAVRVLDEPGAGPQVLPLGQQHPVQRTARVLGAVHDQLAVGARRHLQLRLRHLY